MEAKGRLGWTWPATLAACVAAAGVVSVRERLDVNWDLRNYHYYDAYAFLEGRLGWDVAPAQIQTYHNPLLDLPFWFLNHAIPSPRVTAFAMAAATGIAAYFLIRIAGALFPREKVEDRLLWIALSLAIGLTGAAGLSVIGSTMNEWPPAMLLMAALWLLVASIGRDATPSWNAIAAAGILAGIAAGLKLTYGVFALALWVAIAFVATGRRRWSALAAMGGALLAGFLVSYGLWGAILYREFGNPFFPYFNSIFKSPWWEPVAFFDRTFGPRDALQAIAFPLYFARDHKLVSEVSFRDWRLAVLLVVAVGCLSKYLWQYWRPSPRPSAIGFLPQRGPRGEGEHTANAWKLLAVFTLVAYLAWLKLFGIYRYLVPLEMLAGPLIVGCLLYLVPGRNARRAVIVIVAVLIVGTTRKASWGRIDFRGTQFDVAVPDIPRDSLVILGPYEPMAYIIPFLPREARFVSPHNNFLHYTQANLLQKRIADVIAAHEGPMYALDLHGQGHVEQVLAHYGLARDKGACRPIRSNLDDNAMRLCRVERRAR